MYVIVIYFSKALKCVTTRVNSSITYGIWIIIMYQCRFINCKIVKRGGMLTVWRKKGMWELSVLSVQLCSEPKTTLENKVSFKKNPKFDE